MKPKKILFCVLTGLFALPVAGVFGQSQLRIQIVENFVFPTGGGFTRPQKINNGGDVAGVIDAFSGERRGFVRFRTGNFTPSIVEPNDGGGFTDLRGINDSRALAGNYVGGDGLFHGFFGTLRPVAFTEFDVAGAANTLILGNNNAGDFCGATDDGSGVFQAFVSIGGTVIPVNVPDSSGGSFAYGVNNSGECVGQYTDSSGTGHGWFRDASGNVTAPLDPAGSTAAVLFGLNDRGLVVGRFTDTNGLEHGFVMKMPSLTFAVLDKPDATLTSLNGVNNNNLMTGRFETGNGANGIIAKVSSGPAN